MPRTPSGKKIRGVYQHPAGSGIWWTQYFLAGQRHRERAGSKSTAIALYRKRKTEALDARKLPELALARRIVPFSALLDLAIAFAAAHHKHPSDVLKKAELVRPVFGAIHAGSLTHQHLEAWIDEREISGATFNRYKAFFSLCFREGIRAGLVTHNPATLLRRRRESKGRKRFLTQKEYTAICAAIAARVLRYEAQDNAEHLARRWRRRLAMFIVSVWSGMRRAEQATLEVPQVDWDRAEIQLSETKNGDSREVPLVPQSTAALREVIGGRTSGLVFERERGGEDPANLEMKWFDDLLAELEIADYTWHNNRHTFCSWLAIDGVPLKTIQELAGHRSIQTTAQYAHLSPSAKRAALEATARSHRTAKVKTLPAQRIPAKSAKSATLPKLRKTAN